MKFKYSFGAGLAAVAILCVAVAVMATIPHGYGLDGVALAITALPATLPRDAASLRALRATAYQEMEAALSSDGEDRQTEFDGAAANVERLDAELANVERLQKMKGAAARGTPDSGGAEAEDYAKAQPFMAKYRNLPASAHELRKDQILTDAQTAAFGDLLFAVRRSKLTGRQDDMLINASLGSNESVAEDGGFLVEKDIADGLLRRTFERSMIGSKVRRIPISAKANGVKINALKDDNRTTGARWGGMQTYWIGEGDSLTPTRPKFRQMNLQLKKLAGLLYATSEMLQDSTALSGIIQEAFPDEFSFMVDDAIFEGDGTSRPLGFINGGGKVAIAKDRAGRGLDPVREHHQDVGSLPRALDRQRGMVGQSGHDAGSDVAAPDHRHRRRPGLPAAGWSLRLALRHAARPTGDADRVLRNPGHRRRHRAGGSVAVRDDRQGRYPVRDLDPCRVPDR